MNKPSPARVIAAIRESFEGSVTIYTKGSCIFLYLILKEVFPDAVPYWSETQHHCVTKIGARYYDIEGVFRINDSFQLCPKVVIRLSKRKVTRSKTIHQDFDKPFNLY